MRACLAGFVALIVTASAAAEAQQGVFAEPNSGHSGWTYDVAVGPAVDFMDSCCAEYDFFPSLGVRLSAGRLTAPRLAVSLRLVWDMPLMDNYTGSLRLRPQDFYSLAGPHLTCWLSDDLWLGGMVGVSAISVFDHKDGASANQYSDISIGLSASAGYTFMSRGNDDFSASVEVWHAFDDRSSRAYSILVGYRRW